jgi:hypothetical protein
MNQPRSVVPPAPPPFWQSEQVVVPTSARSIRPSVLGFFVASCTITILTGLILVCRRRGRTRHRAEEIRLRESLVPRFGPDAAWLSASALAQRAEDAGIPAAHQARTAIARLSMIESRRYGPNPAEPADHQRNDQSA